MPTSKKQNKMPLNEDLVKLYKSTESKKSKDILFKRLLENNKSGLNQLVSYYNSKININIYDDLQQEAYLALIEAIKYFKSDKGTLFWTFANITIRQRLKKYVDECYKTKNIDNISIKKSDNHIHLGYIDNSAEHSSLEDFKSNSYNFINNKDFDYIDENILDNEFRKDILSQYLDEAFPEESNAKKFYYLKNGLSNNQTQTCKNIGRLYGVTQQNVDKSCRKSDARIKKLIERDIKLGKIGLEDLL